MNPFRKHVEDLVEKARNLHAGERKVSLESVDLVGELDLRNAGGNLMLFSADLARRIGLTPNQYWKRTQVARLLRYFPVFRGLVVSGATSISHLSQITPHVTQANLAVFLAELPGRTQRQVAELVATPTPSGSRIVAAAADSQAVLLDRALTVSQSRGRRLTKSQVMSEALKMWLDEWDFAPSLRKEA